ncbi:tyrosine-protein kinase transmembrane receptor Ror-like isoform X3 [Bombus impatiens]|uniref:Tyrosine-protein kinase transmembrane receptor Ror-like isoform X3 n=1 Tax=Bombus impatiens TaxID=132113 RepID=A0A6P6FB84_BOMIM|nr:tyrosine-protein kinase transmembrane receptor Ror-like isoform X3 [Bombus impatiens]
MERRRMPRRRGLSSAEIRAELSATTESTQQSEVILPINGNAVITGCKDRPQICGKEAACRSFTDNTSKCVCPHDLSPPTTDLKCPNRLIVPLTPRPIPNIIPPNGNSTNSTTALPEAEQGTPMNLKKGLLLANKYTPNPQYFSCASPEVPILQRESLVFLEDIGEGCFGKVYKGESCVGDSKEIVAIKVLKESASREAEEDFMREVDIMSTFGHRNILSLKGVVLREGNNSPWMVFEYMPYGDLAEVLRSNSRQFSRTTKPGLQPLTQESLHWITIQIAAGMTYLSGQRFVHRDLACRNCLVGSDLVVKIADFGMSRDVYTCDYYKIGGSRLLPVRWMSPESVMYGRFTLESDVWSFGVVLWEVYSFGKQPYYGHNNEEVVKLIFQGIMLIPPEGCPPFVCQLMRECWKTDPKDRIKFSEILERLEKAKGKSIQQDTLPRPPQGPVTIRTPDVLDPDGYLLPAPTKPHEYLQTLPALSD